MTSLYFSAVELYQYFKDLQRQFGGTDDLAPLVVFKNSGTAGFAYYCDLDPELSLLFEQYKGPKYLRIQQSPTPPDERLVLRLLKTNAKVLIYDPKFRKLEPSAGIDSNFYMICTSEDVGFELAPPTGNSDIKIQLLTLVFTKKFLEQNFNANQDLRKWPLLREWLKKKEPVVIKKPVRQLVSGQIRELFETVASSQNILQIKRDLYDSLTKIFEILQAGKNNVKQQDWDVLTQVHSLLLRDLSKAPDVHDLAEVAQMSVTKLKIIFKKRYGESLYAYFLNARLARAKTLLETGRYTVGQVAIKMGYSQTTKLIVPFKKRYKATPFTFRKSGTEYGTE